jgi:hypothetical protein
VLIELQMSKDGMGGATVFGALTAEVMAPARQHSGPAQ